VGLVWLGIPRVSDAATISLTAVISDRGSDTFPRDGNFDSMFGDASVTQVTTPPAGDLGTEERTAVEFLLDPVLIGNVIDSVTLLLSPQGNNLNIGLGANEVAEAHGYTGDGALGTADLSVSNIVAMFSGPAPNGQLAVVLSTSWLQALVDSSAPYAGLMFKGVDGPMAVTFNFAGTASGIPLGARPTLNIEYHAAETMQPVPEPATLTLIGTGFAALAGRRWQRKRRAAVVS
jgi:hypothetical protein